MIKYVVVAVSVLLTVNSNAQFANTEKAGIKPLDVVQHPEIYDVSERVSFRTEKLNMVDALEQTSNLLAQYKCGVVGNIENAEAVQKYYQSGPNRSYSDALIKDGRVFYLPTYFYDFEAHPINSDYDHGYVRLQWIYRVLIEPVDAGYRVSLALDQKNESSRGSTLRQLGFRQNAVKTLGTAVVQVPTLAKFTSDAAKNVEGAFVLPNSIPVRLVCE